MDNQTKLKGMLGLASKAGCLIFGTELVSESVRRGKCKKAFAASDTAANTRKRILKYCTAYKADLLETNLTKSEIANCTGKKKDLSIVGTENENFAKALADLCEQTTINQAEI